MLEPDLFDELVTSGKGFAETPAYAAAARSSDGRLAIIYVPESQTITLDLARLSGPAKARWFDPTDGSYKSAESAPVPNSGRHEFTPPGKNAAGDTDFVLVLEASGRK